MTGCNRTFDLAPDDLDLIESALRRRKRALSDKRPHLAAAPGGPRPGPRCCATLLPGCAASTG
ncbi:MAG: hypothetical protein GDA53_05390 [Rhodobacteraceae bacterium]|nr:hypothetical protein [Paracoccaceae bacterium]